MENHGLDKTKTWILLIRWTDTDTERERNRGGGREREWEREWVRNLGRVTVLHKTDMWDLYAYYIS